MMKSDFATMHRLIRRIQQRNRFVDTSTSTGLTLLETHILIELQASGETLTQGDLQKIFHLEQSAVSRLTTQMQGRELLRKDDKSTSGVRRLALTKKAASIIKKVDAEANTLIRSFSSVMSEEDFTHLTEFTERIADFYDQPVTALRKSDSRFRLAQRRITRALHLLGSDVFGSKLSSIEWHVLSEVVLSDTIPVRIVELSGLLSVPQNSLTSIIKKLEEKKLIRREASLTDKRIAHLTATSGGKKLYTKIEERAVSDLAECFASTTERWRKHSVELLSRYAADADGVRPPLLPGYSLVEVTSEKERRDARGLAARISVELGTEADLPEVFLSSAHTVFVLTYLEKPCGVYEVTYSQKDSTLQILFSCVTKKVSDWARSGVMNRLELLFQGSAALPRAS